MASRVVESMTVLNRHSHIDTGDRMDMFVPTKHRSTDAPLSRDVREYNPSNTAALDSVVYFDVPKTGFLGNVFVSTTWGTTSSGTYAPQLGMKCIKTVRLISDGNNVQEFEYKPAMNAVLHGLEPDRANAIMNLADGGDTTPGTTTGGPFGPYIAILPLFNCNLVHNDSFVQPIPVSHLSGVLRIELVMEPLSACLASGATGGSLASLKFYVERFLSTDAKHKEVKSNKWSFKSVDFQTFRSTNNLATATAETVNITSFTGHINRLFAYLITTTNIAANIDFTGFAAATGGFELELSGERFYNITSDSADGAITTTQNLLMYDHNRALAVLDSAGTESGAVYWIPFSADKSYRGFAGALNAINSGVRELTFKVTQSSGGNAKLDVVAVYDCHYYINEEGSLRREK